MNTKLKDPRWQKLRLQVMERDGWRCVACGAEDKELHAHHMLYHGDPWATPPELIQTLCLDCHAKLGKHPKAGVRWEDGQIKCSHCPVCGWPKHSGPVCPSCGHAMLFGIEDGWHWMRVLDARVRDSHDCLGKILSFVVDAYSKNGNGNHCMQVELLLRHDDLDRDLDVYNSRNMLARICKKNNLSGRDSSELVGASFKGYVKSGVFALRYTLHEPNAF